MRLLIVLPVLVTVLVTVLASCTQTPPVAAPTASAQGVTSIPAPFPSTRATTTTRPNPSTTAPAGGLPSDLVPNVVEDECLLTPEQFGSLAGRQVARAENTELADAGARRSCFYTATGNEPVGRIDVYAPAAASARDLVARIATHSAGARSLPGIGDGCVVVPGQEGSFELVVGSRALLVVLTLPAGAAAAPQDAAWAMAATAMLSGLPG